MTKPETHAQQLLEDYYAECNRKGGYIPLSDVPVGRSILEADERTQIEVIQAALFSSTPVPSWIVPLNVLRLSYEKFPSFTIDDIQVMLQGLGNAENQAGIPTWDLLRGLAPLLENPETFAACCPALEQLREKIRRWDSSGYRHHTSEDQHKFLRQLDWILWGLPDQELAIPSHHWGEQKNSWGALIWTSFQDMEPALRLPWMTLLQHCTRANGATPTNKWRQQMLGLIQALGQDVFCRQVAVWFEDFLNCESPWCEDIPLLNSLLCGCAEINDSALVDHIHILLQRPPQQPLKLLRGIAVLLENPETFAACRPALEQLRERVNISGSRDILRQLDWILWGLPDQELVIPDDNWGALIWTSFQDMEPALRLPWMTLLQHCARANGATPTNKWQQQMLDLIKPIGWEDFWGRFAAWLGAYYSIGHFYAESESTISLVKGLIWCCAQFNDITVASLLADTAIKGYHVTTAWIANACIYALKRMPSLHGIAQLERVRLKVKQHGYRKLVEKALAEAAQHAGLSRLDLEELTIPTFDLQQGRRRITIGTAAVELQVAGSRVKFQWYDIEGKPQKAEPSVVKREHKAELKEVKILAESLAHLLTAQRDRIERLFLTQRTWSLSAWRERYLEHPLVGTVAGRLIWRFQIAERIISACWFDGRLVDASDLPVELSEEMVVSLWHPVLCKVSEVVAWRTWLEQHQITQPFKQAHREVYLLTDAERATGTYSNRFAAHILHQHQFHALALGRGWRDEIELMLGYGHTPTTLDLPEWGLQADFSVDGLHDPTAIAQAVGYRYVTTDCVCFFQMEHAVSATERVPLEQVPPLVFSEVMRDVDLFVGVTSVGNDPTWHDRGAQYGDYWHSYSFGELSTTAQARKQLLERLLPRLAIGDRCNINGRFLVVRGDLRTYKIHLGSTNILMEPNDQYLCIVPGHKGSETSAENVLLPFEGDVVFSTILSKAFLLAEDRMITDPKITSQIGKTS